MESVRSRLAFNAIALQHMEERTATLLLAQERASAAAASAQDTLNAVEAELHDLRDRRTGVSATVSELRASLAAHLVTSFPTEILSAIFAEVIASPCDWEGWMPSWNTPEPPKDIMPLTLTAVCSRWRREAVRMPHLWTFIVIPLPTAERTPALKYLDMMLERSHRAPLDIVLRWNASGQTLSLSVCEHIFAELGQVAQRLRRLHCTLRQDSQATSLLLEFLQHPMPKLLDLAVEASSLSSQITGTPTDEFLGFCVPYSPQLRRLHTDISHVLEPNGYPSIKYLAMHLGVSGNAVWGLLRGCSSLEYLDLGLWDAWDDPADYSLPPAFTLVLPALRSLVTRSKSDALLNAWADYLNLPRLESLDLQDSVSGAATNFMENIPQSLTTLSYCTYRTLDGHDAAQLRIFENIRFVSLSEPGADFYKYLLEHNVWPKLETLTVGIGSTQDKDDRALVAFVRTRRERPDMASLQRVVLEDVTGPDWLTESLEFWTSPASGPPSPHAVSS